MGHEPHSTIKGMTKMKLTNDTKHALAAGILMFSLIILCGYIYNEVLKRDPLPPQDCGFGCTYEQPR